MNLEEAKRIVARAVFIDATELYLNSASNSNIEAETKNIDFTLSKSNIRFYEDGKLSDNDITKLLPDILKLKRLRRLYLTGNQLTTFNKEFAKLQNLILLDLSNNELTTFDSEFANLTDLHALDLSNNKLTTFDKEFTKLKKLQKLKLDHNQIDKFDIEFAKLQNLQRLDLYENPLPFPEEILQDFMNPRKILNFIADYYEAEEKGSLRPINEAKLVVVGEANVGKTCVINRLIHDTFIQTDSTHGIEIRRWKRVELEGGEKVQLNVWDFGGQEIMHSTHQFFFTKRTVYILVINARKNEDTNKTEEWLQRIQNLSHNSPVFIVGNKIDENNRGTDRTSLGYFDIERKRLNEKFPNLIKGVYGISSDVREKKYNFLFEEFRNALISEIGKLEEIHTKFPMSWFKVKAQLEKMQASKVPYITFRDYLSRCIKADIESEESQRTLIDFMHDLGIALSFQDDKELRDLAVLNPEWVTCGVYALIDNAQITHEKGILKREDISKYLNEEEYPKKTQDFIIKMMRKFQLLVDIQPNKVFLIPDLLPKDETETGKWDDTLHFQYSYDIYEKSILRRFMVEVFHLCSKETYWRNGIVLKNNGNRALVKADVQDKTISIKIDGNQNTRREFIAVIRSKFDEIHASFDGLIYREMLGHPKHPKILRAYGRLRLMEDDEIEKEYVEELRTSLPVKEWLNGFYSVEERRRKDEAKESGGIVVTGDYNTIINRVSNSEINIGKIVDDISQEMNDAQKQMMEKLAEEVISRLEEGFAKSGKENYELKEIKKGLWETKIKFALTFVPLEFSRTVTPDEFISKVQKWF